MTINSNGPELSLSDILRAVWRFKWVVVLATGLGLSISLLASRGRPTVFSGKGFFAVDAGFENTEVLPPSSSNFVPLHFVELMDAGGVDQLLSSDELENGSVSSIRVQNSQTPTTIVVTVFGGDEQAVAKVLAEFPDRAARVSFVKTLYDRAQIQIQSQLEILKPALSVAAGSRLKNNSRADELTAVRSLSEMTKKVSELTRLSSEKSLFARTGDTDGPHLVRVRTRLNAILGAVLGFLIGSGVSVVLSVRTASGRA